MPVHTIRIESTSDQNHIELCSAATWARGPGRTLSFHADGSGAGDARLDIGDRVIRLSRAGPGSGPMTLVVQVATAADRLTLRTEKTGDGILVVSSDADRRVNDRQERSAVTATLVLFLDRSAARTGADERSEGDDGNEERDTS